MHTRDNVRHELSPMPPAGRLFDGIGRTTVIAASALAGCTLLVGVGTTLSMCWMVHPLLSAVAATAILYLAARLAGKVFRV